MVYRIYVEKKPGFDVEANGLKNELTSLLGIKDLTGLRLLNRYDVEGIDEALFNQCVSTVFSEPPVDNTYAELPAAEGVSFAVEYLPGQFDQRAASAAECIQLISQGESIKALLIRENHKGIGFNEVCDKGTQRVVVAHLDFIGDDRVIFVDDRHAPQTQDFNQGIPGIEVALAVRKISVRKQNLRCFDAVPGKARLIGLHQPHLAHGRRGLQFKKALGTGLPAKP